jgi:hypothetical protein
MTPRIASVVIVAFLGAELYAGFAGRDMYPFSHFPMYSEVRADPYRAEHHEIVGLLPGGGTTRDVAAPLGTALLLAWARDAEGDAPRLERLEDMLLAYNRRRRPNLRLVGIRLTRSTYVLPAHPHPARPRRTGVEILHETPG